MTRPARPTELDIDGAIEVIARAVTRVAAATTDVVVPGGRGLIPLLGPLARAGLPTTGWRLHLSDERVVPRGHPDRNVDAVADMLGMMAVDDAGIGAAEGFVLLGPPDGHDGLPSLAAWNAALAATPAFAITILGVGADGHTAGLFPGGPLGAAEDAAMALEIPPSGDLPHRRVSMSARRLAHTGAVLLIAVGPGKESAVAAIRDGTDAGRPTGALLESPRYLLVAETDGGSRKSTRV